MTKDFDKWISHKPAWGEIVHQINTGKAYQHKQDLVALFLNCFVYLEDKVKAYHNEHSFLPIEYLNDAVYEFRKYFPLKGRHEGFNYFDDLIEALINELKSKPVQQKSDITYSLTSLDQDETKQTDIYNSLQADIQRNGFLQVKLGDKTYKVYTPEMEIILTSTELPVLNTKTKAKTTVNGWDYCVSYAKAYNEGEAYFENEHKLSTNTLYGENAEQYVKDIHYNFFHAKITDFNEGWSFVKKRYPVTINHEMIKKYGYFSGIVNKVNELIKKAPNLFSTFDKCEHNLPPQQTETKTDKLKVPQIALIHVYEGKQITEENAKEIAAKYGYTAKTSGKGLYHDYLKYCKTSDRKAKPTAETKKTLINKIELFKSVVNHLSEKAKQKANDEINILNTILENEYQ